MKHEARRRGRAEGMLFWAMVSIAAGCMHCWSSQNEPGKGADAEAGTTAEAMADARPDATGTAADAQPEATGAAADAQPDATGAATDAQSDVVARDGADASDDVLSSADADAAGALTLSPLAPTATGCSTTIVTFTASGGVPPYTWSTSDTASNDLVVQSATQATWEDNADNFCGHSGTVDVTVGDSLGATVTTTITVTPG